MTRLKQAFDCPPFAVTRALSFPYSARVFVWAEAKCAPTNLLFVCASPRLGRFARKTRPGRVSSGNGSSSFDPSSGALPLPPIAAE